MVFSVVSRKKFCGFPQEILWFLSSLAGEAPARGKLIAGFFLNVYIYLAVV